MKNITNISYFKYKDGSYHIGFFIGKSFQYEIIKERSKAIKRYKELKNEEYRGN